MQLPKESRKKNSGLPAEMFAQHHKLRRQLGWSLNLFLYYFIRVWESTKKNARGTQEKQGVLGPAEIRVNVHSRMPSWQEKGKRFKDCRSRTSTKAFWALTSTLYPPVIESLEPKYSLSTVKPRLYRHWGGLGRVCFNGVSVLSGLN